MANGDHYDVIIIGTGAGGGTLAHRLAPTGKRVLLLERGDYLPRERDNWDSTAVFVKGKYRAPEFWYDKHGNEFPPEVNYYVGGNTKFYGAALFRLRPEDFGELRHHGGDLARPGRSATTTWSRTTPRPSTSTWCTAGTARTRPRARPAPSTPTRRSQHEPRIQQLSDDLEKRGLHPFHLPIGVEPHQDAHGRADPRQRVHPLRPRRRLPLPGRARSRTRRSSASTRPSSMTTSSWSPAPRASGWRPTRPAARSTAVVAELEDGAETATFSADIVVVACGAVNSAALLLRSANDRHPGRAGQQLRRGRAATTCGTTTSP